MGQQECVEGSGLPEAVMAARGGDSPKRQDEGGEWVESRGERHP